MQPTYAIRHITDLSPGDHLCGLYRTEAEHRAALTPFLRSGLEGGEKVLYIADAHTAETILGYLRDEGLAVDTYLARGQLRFLTPEDAYLKEGFFDPDRMMALWRTETDRALAEGYPCLRATAEMTWALRGLPGSDRLIEYEARLNTFFPGSKCMALCQYDARRFGEGVLLDVLTTHPTAVVGAELYDNFYYLPPHDLLGADRQAATLRHWLENLAARKETEVSLRRARDELEARVEERTAELLRANDALRTEMNLRERAEATLRESEERHRLVAETARDAIVTIDEQGTILFANAAAAEMFGYAIPEMIGCQITLLIPDQLQERHLNSLRGYLATGRRQFAWERMELPGRHKSGGEILLEASLAEFTQDGVHVFSAILRDITERKRMLEALRESEARLRSAFGDAAIGMALVATDGRLLQVNRSLCEMVGYSEQELMSLSFQAIIHPDDLAPKLAYVRQALTGERRSFQMENRYIHKQGHVVWIVLSASLVCDAGGIPQYFVSQIQDITERKRAEQSLEHSRAHLESFVEHTPAAVAMFDKSLRYVAVSRRWLHDYRLGDQNVIGRHHYDVFPEIRKRKEWQEVHQRCLAGAVERRDEDRFVRQDDSEDWLRWEVRPWYDVGGEIGGIIMFTEVITERKRAEEALRESEARYHQLIDLSQDAIYLIDDKANFLLTNPAGCALLGYTEQELVGMSVVNTYLPVERPVVGKRLQQIAGGRPLRFERVAMRKDGTTVPIEVSLSPITHGRYQAVVRDITERKLAEETLQDAFHRLQELHSIINKSPAVVFLWRAAEGWPVQFASENVAQFGYAPDDFMTGRIPYASIVHPDDWGRVAAEVAQYTREGRGEFAQEYRILGMSGRVHWADARTWVRRDAGGAVTHYEGILLDFTERRRAEEALRESEARFRSLFDGVPVGLYRTTPAGQTLDVNPALVQMLGYSSRDAFLAVNVAGLYVNPEDRRRWQDLIEREGIVRGFEIQLRRCDGTPIWAEVNARVVRDAGGRVLYYEGTTQDITERKLAENIHRGLYEASLHISEAVGLEDRLERLLQTARSVLGLDRVNICLADSEGRWLEVVAGLGTEVPVEGIRIPIGPDGGGVAQAYLTQQMIVWDGRRPVPEPLRLKPPYDQIKGFRSRVFANVPLIVQGRAIGVLGADRKYSRRPLEPATLELLQLFAAQTAIAIDNARLFTEVRDAGERMQTLSRRLVEVQETERREISRELHDRAGQGLTALGINLNILRGHISAESAATGRARLDDSLRLVEETVRSIRGVMDDLRPHVLDDYGLLAALHWYGEQFFRRTGLPMEVRGEELISRLPLEVETALFRIAQEALTNVAKHARASTVTVTLDETADVIRLSVADNGIGFDPAAVRRPRERPGWGLITMQERAEAVGGRLWVDSQPGRGARIAAEVKRESGNLATRQSGTRELQV